MISELSDNEILDFLMTSDFDGDFSPEELKYLLLKWRNFHRMYHGRYERMHENYEAEIRMLKDQIEIEKKKNLDTLIESAKKSDIIDSLKVRDLTWKERIYGKIIYKEDENK